MEIMNAAVLDILFSSLKMVLKKHPFD